MTQNCIFPTDKQRSPIAVGYLGRVLVERIRKDLDQDPRRPKISSGLPYATGWVVHKASGQAKRQQQ